MELRPLTAAGAAPAAALFRDSIFSLCAADYSPAQLAAWAAAADDPGAWEHSFDGRLALAAVCEGELAGFADADMGAGYLDRLYVSPKYRGRGAAAALCAEIEKACGGRVYTHASITARGFFERRGYALLGENRVFRRGVALINFTMALRVRR